MFPFMRTPEGRTVAYTKSRQRGNTRWQNQALSQGLSVSLTPGAFYQCRLSWPQIHRNPLASASCVLGGKVSTSTASSINILIRSSTPHTQVVPRSRLWGRMCNQCRSSNICRRSSVPALWVHAPQWNRSMGEPPGYPSEISQAQEDKDRRSSLTQGIFSEKVKYIEMESEKILREKVKEIRVG